MGRFVVTLCSILVKADVTMRIAGYYLILCSLFVYSYGLRCRLQGGPKEDEIKEVYNICIRQKVKGNSSYSNGDLDQDWKESRRYNRWSQNNRNRGSSDYETDERSPGEGNRMGNRDRADEHNKMRQQDRGSKNRENRMQNRDTNGDETMYSRGERHNTYGDHRSQSDNGINDRNDFFKNQNTNGYNNEQYSRQPSRRYKRERRFEVNTGKRSQHNPNQQRHSGHEDRYDDEDGNSNENNSTKGGDTSACAIHCLMENLEMTGDSGKPDRYLVIHKFTKDVKDEELKDFLQESIEECFQILDNENINDKCEFSKSLMMCLSEKGRANCDDWQDNFQY